MSLAGKIRGSSTASNARGGHPEHDAFLERAVSPRKGLALETLEFLGENKKWWLAPIVLLIALLGFLVSIGGSAAGPFIYTLF